MAKAIPVKHHMRFDSIRYGFGYGLGLGLEYGTEFPMSRNHPRFGSSIWDGKRAQAKYLLDFQTKHFKLYYDMKRNLKTLVSYC